MCKQISLIGKQAGKEKNNVSDNDEFHKFFLQRYLMVVFHFFHDKYN